MSNLDMKVEHILLSRIDEPEHAMRSEVWDEDLDALAESIKRFGLLQPVTLRKKGERYEVIAGHRRLVAHRKLGVPMIAAIVREADDITSDAMKVHENLYRADVNPVDQAAFLYEYMERAKLSISELAEQLNRTPQWVQSRVSMLAYPEYLLAFVGEGKLSMATAEVLNQIQHPLVKEKYCKDAALIGLSASRARYWLAQSRVTANNPQSMTVEEPPVGAPDTEKPILKFRCTFDGQDYPASEMTMVYVHPENLAHYERAIREGMEDLQIKRASASEAAEPQSE